MHIGSKKCDTTVREIHFGFKNANVLNLLTERANCLKAYEFDDAKKVEEKINKYK